MSPNERDVTVEALMVPGPIERLGDRAQKLHALAVGLVAPFRQGLLVSRPGFVLLGLEKLEILEKARVLGLKGQALREFGAGLLLGLQPGAVVREPQQLARHPLEGLLLLREQSRRRFRRVCSGGQNRNEGEAGQSGEPQVRSSWARCRTRDQPSKTGLGYSGRATKRSTRGLHSIVPP